MRFTELPLCGAYIIEPDLIEDERGFFARCFCKEEFIRLKLKTEITQSNISFNEKRGTLRGMHYQETPHQEAKLVRCTMGSIFDVIIDLRCGSPSFKKWFGINITSLNRQMLYIPEGCAHGFQTLEDNVEVFYQMFDYYDPDSSRGVRWDDPAFSIEWPMPVSRISEKDNSYEALIE